MAFVPIDREFFRSIFWLKHRAYSEAEAYIDLLQKVRVDASPLEKLLPNGKLLTVNRHEVHASLRYLASQWRWSTKKVKRFLDILEKKQYLKRRTQHQETILYVENTSVSLPNNSKRETLKETSKETLKKQQGNTSETHRNGHSQKSVCENQTFAGIDRAYDPGGRSGETIRPVATRKREIYSTRRHVAQSGAVERRTITINNQTLNQHERR